MNDVGVCMNVLVSNKKVTNLQTLYKLLTFLEKGVYIRLTTFAIMYVIALVIICSITAIVAWNQYKKYCLLSIGMVDSKVVELT